MTASRFLTASHSTLSSELFAFSDDEFIFVEDISGVR